MCRSKASPCSFALCAHWAAERRGKWKHSIGNHPRSGANGLSTSAWLPARQPDLRMPAMEDLADRLVERRRVVDRRERREAHGHPVGERLLAGSRAEHAEERAHRPVPRRHRREHLGERRPARPPELVRVGVDHPVGPVIGGREARHARDPLVLAQVLAGLADQVDVARPRVLLEHLRRPVLRAVVGRDHEVGAGVQMEREPRVDDVDLVAREERHDQRHRRASLRAARSGASFERAEPAPRARARAARRGRCRRSRRGRTPPPRTPRPRRRSAGGTRAAARRPGRTKLPSSSRSARSTSRRRVSIASVPSASPRASASSSIVCPS